MADFYSRRTVCLYNIQQVAFAPKIVTLALQIFTRRLSFLVDDFSLLNPNPLQFRDREQANIFTAHAQRGRDAHLAFGGINAEVDILDVLFHHVYRKRAELQRSSHRISIPSAA